MLSQTWMAIGMAAAALMMMLLFCALLTNQLGVAVVDFSRRFARHPFGGVLVLLFAVVLFVHGSTKVTPGEQDKPHDEPSEESSSGEQTDPGEQTKPGGEGEQMKYLFLYEENALGFAVGQTAPYASAATVYDGYLHDGDGAVRGAIQVKVAKGKVDGKTGAFSAKVTAAVQLADGSKKISFKNDVADATGKVSSMSTGGHTLDVSFGLNGLGGKFDGRYSIDGARNIFSAKDAESKVEAKAIESMWVGAVNVVGDGIALAVSIAKKGKVKVSGTVNGAKVSATSQLLVGEEACCIPVIITKKANLAFNLWLLGDGSVEVAGLEDVVAGKAGSLKPGAAFRMDGAALSAKLSGLYGDYLPDGLSVSQSGAKWVVAGGAKAGKLKLVKGTSEIDREKSKLTDNMSGLKLTYKSKDGSFKGSFKAYNLEKGKIKAYTVNVTGVMIGDTAFGTATLKKPAVSFPVTVE